MAPRPPPLDTTRRQPRTSWSNLWEDTRASFIKSAHAARLSLVKFVPVRATAAKDDSPKKKRTLRSTVDLPFTLDCTLERWLTRPRCCGALFFSEESMRDAQKVPLMRGMPVLFVGTVFALVGTSFTIGYLPAAHLSPLGATALKFDGAMLMALWSYAKALGTDPGGIPESADWQLGSNLPHASEQKKSTGARRYCKRERRFKPDRAHFCKVSERNVLRMDHFCPWLTNAVGFFNYKHFYLFVTYSTIAIDFASWHMGSLVLLKASTLAPGAHYLMGESTSLCAALSCLLTPFWAFHTTLLAKNMTTIEFAECWMPRLPARTAQITAESDDSLPASVREAGDAHSGSEESKSAGTSSRASGGAYLGDSESDAALEEGMSIWDIVFKYRSPYDLGLYHNVSSVFGPEPWLWPLPVGGPAGDGLSFPTWSQHSAAATVPPSEVESATGAPSPRVESETAAAAEEAGGATHDAQAERAPGSQGAPGQDESQSEPTGTEERPSTLAEELV